ncbi:MAG TPA: hypothetical protein VMV74_09135 [Bacteroidales bacterium]|nr:hypothetical protein [Bacteroidales bacterium]
MSNVSAKINLMNLKVVRKMINGQSGPVDCIVVPIEANHLFVGEKGIYLDIAGFEIKNPSGDSKDTHLLKQSLPKEMYQAMTDEQKRAQPILGNLRIWAGFTEAEPASNMESTPEVSDLPF